MVSRYKKFEKTSSNSYDILHSSELLAQVYSTSSNDPIANLSVNELLQNLTKTWSVCKDVCYIPMKTHPFSFLYILSQGDETY